MMCDDIDSLILNDPAEYERLLHSYTILLGERKLWWERVADAERDGWKNAVRRAIAQVAGQCGIHAAMLAQWLDVGEFPKTRMLILGIARDRMRGRT